MTAVKGIEKKEENNSFTIWETEEDIGSQIRKLKIEKEQQFINRT